MLRNIGWWLVMFSVAVLALTFPSPRAAGRVWVPALIPLFGVPFAVLFTAALYALAMRLKSVRGLVLITVLLGVGMLLAWAGRAMNLWGGFEQYNISYARHVLCGGACAAGVGLGAGIIKGWVRNERSEDKQT